MFLTVPCKHSSAPHLTALLDVDWWHSLWRAAKACVDLKAIRILGLTPSSCDHWDWLEVEQPAQPKTISRSALCLGKDYSVRLITIWHPSQLRAEQVSPNLIWPKALWPFNWTQIFGLCILFHFIFYPHGGFSDIELNTATRERKKRGEAVDRGGGGG